LQYYCIQDLDRTRHRFPLDCRCGKLVTVIIGLRARAKSLYESERNKLLTRQSDLIVSQENPVLSRNLRPVIGSSVGDGTEVS
jgi:hypothetical protein